VEGTGLVQAFPLAEAREAAFVAKGSPLALRYVRIEQGDTLSLAEVEVLSGWKNIAPAGKAAQSATAAGGAAERAIDGNTDGNWKVNSTTHTPQGAPGWWELDLGGVKSVEAVRVWNRTDCCGERLQGAVLTLLGGDRAVVYKKTLMQTPNPSEIAFVVKEEPPVNLDEKPIALRLAEIAPRFAAPSEDPAMVMPVGGGDLSAMLRYGSALEIHLSKSDFYAVEAKPYHKSPNIHSPGHVSLDFGIPTHAPVKFEQRLDLVRGSVAFSLETPEGKVAGEAIGIMGKNALVVSVTDTRPARRVSAAFSCGRPGMEISGAGGMLLGKEVHDYDEKGKIPSDPSKVDPADRMFRLGVATAVALSDGRGPLALDAKEMGEGSARVVSLAGAAPGKYRLIIATETSYDGKPEAAAKALLEATRSADPVALMEGHVAWWDAFWKPSEIDLYGKDADYLMRLWYVTLYNYASTRGPAHAPTKFNGGPGLVRGDERSWGWGYWFQNTRELLWPMFASGHGDFARAYLDFYDRMYMDCKSQTAKEGKVGIRMWEGTLPSKPGAAVREKALSAFDAAALDKAILDTRMEECKSGYNARSLTQVAELVQLMFDYAAYTGDEAYLKKTAGPWFKEAVLFYLSYLKEGEDGLWHMTPSDAIEMWWKVKDPMTDLCALRYLLWNAVHQGAAFGFEPALIALAKERASKLAPIPLGLWKRRKATPADLPPGSPSYYTEVLDVIDRASTNFAPAGDALDDRIVHNQEHPELYIVYPMALVDARSPKADVERAVNTFRARKHPNSAGWSQCPVQAARLRLPDTIDVILDHARRHQRFPYGGWNSPAGALKGSATGATDTPYFDAAGVNMTALQEALLQCHELTRDQRVDLMGSGPIAVAPAVREDWAGKFRLRARGGFLVEARFQKGRKIQRLVIHSTRGGLLPVENPFAKCRVTADGKEILLSSEAVVKVDTKVGAVYEFSGI